VGATGSLPKVGCSSVLRVGLALLPNSREARIGQA